MSRDNHCPVVLVAGFFFFCLFVVDFFLEPHKSESHKEKCKNVGILTIKGRCADVRVCSGK